MRASDKKLAAWLMVPVLALGLAMGCTKYNPTTGQNEVDYGATAGVAGAAMGAAALGVALSNNHDDDRYYYGGPGYYGGGGGYYRGGGNSYNRRNDVNVNRNVTVNNKSKRANVYRGGDRSRQFNKAAVQNRAHNVDRSKMANRPRPNGGGGGKWAGRKGR
jgi:hypothetical protein